MLNLVISHNMNRMTAGLLTKVVINIVNLGMIFRRNLYLYSVFQVVTVNRKFISVSPPISS